MIQKRINTSTGFFIFYEQIFIEKEMKASSNWVVEGRRKKMRSSKAESQIKPYFDWFLKIVMVDLFLFEKQEEKERSSI